MKWGGWRRDRLDVGVDVVKWGGWNEMRGQWAVGLEANKMSCDVGQEMKSPPQLITNPKIKSELSWTLRSKLRKKYGQVADN